MGLEWRTERRQVAELKDYPHNPRNFTEKGMADLKASIRTLGYIDPIAVNLDGTIIGGHARKQTLIALGLTEIDVRIPNRQLTDKEVDQAIIRLNRNTAGEWDFKVLEDSFERSDLLEWGFEKSEFNVFGTHAIEGEDDIPEAPLKPITSMGDIWVMGNHRLMCGSAIEADHVDGLLAGLRPDTLYTDPPYGIDVVRKGKIGGDKPFGKNGFDGVIKCGIYKPIIGDHSIQSALDAYSICENLKIKTIILWGGNFYAHKLPPAKCWIVWDKQTDGNFGDGEIAWCNADKSIRIFRHKWSGMIKASERGEKRVHPTQKPIALAEWAFEEFKAKKILDLFMGSGSTLIAAEKTNRLCYGMELSPEYCDVIVIRWQNFTGKQAVHAVTGKAFNDNAKKQALNPALRKTTKKAG